MEKAIIKFNGGNLALLCSLCKVTIKTGFQFTEKEKRAARGNGGVVLHPQYCKACSKILKLR